MVWKIKITLLREVSIVYLHLYFKTTAYFELLKENTWILHKRKLSCRVELCFSWIEISVASLVLTLK